MLSVKLGKLIQIAVSAFYKVSEVGSVNPQLPAMWLYYSNITINIGGIHL